MRLMNMGRQYRSVGCLAYSHYQYDERMIVYYVFALLDLWYSQ